MNLDNVPIEIADLHDKEDTFRAFSLFGRDAAKAFPRLKTEGLVSPMHTLRDCLNWAFLARRNGREISAIHDGMAFVTRRAIGICASGEWDKPYCLRETLDNFLMHCAVLSSDVKLMQEAAKTVIEAGVDARMHQYTQAWTGILKFCVLKDSTREADQLRIFLDGKPDRVFPWPTKSLVEAFVARDDKRFNKALRDNALKHWQMAQRAGAIEEQSSNRVMLRVTSKNPHFLWAHVEACFAMLAQISGMAVPYSGFWLPREIIAENEQSEQAPK